MPRALGNEYIYFSPTRTHYLDLFLTLNEAAKPCKISALSYFYILTDVLLIPAAKRGHFPVKKGRILSFYFFLKFNLFRVDSLS